jgi:TolB-like protein/Flp pilus assembly protein TadD
MSAMTSFFHELKRRKVYRVAVTYVVAGGGVIQLASAVFPAWELPNWSLRLVIMLLLLGFPIALMLAWAFDVTPEGIRATTPVLHPDTPSDVANRHRRRNISLLVGLGLIVSATAGFFLLPRAGAMRMEKSIAVLPFENFSDKPENAYFADGIQDDILTNLSKIGDLKVISRTSVMGYRDKPKSLREIGKELGVSAILEGSVRSDGKRVRVNVQLINAQNDRHLWAEDYDRELTDVFEIQTDLAQNIATELKAQLSPNEKATIERRPTQKNEAYLAYVEAHNLQAAMEDRAKLTQARQLYERAIELDPKFVLAIANLSILHSWFYHTLQPIDAERKSAKDYADRALALAPDLPEAHLAKGYSLYYGARDFEGALREFGVAQRGLPNDSDIYLVIGAIQRRQGKWPESTANLEKAVSLDPKHTWPLQNLFFNYQMLRDFDAATRVIDKALAIEPKSFNLWALKAKLALHARGDLSVGEKALAEFEQAEAKGELPKDLDPETKLQFHLGKATVLAFRRKFPEALEVVQKIPEEELNSSPHAAYEVRSCEGILLEKVGQTEKAHAVFLKLKQLAETAVREAPDDADRHAKLGRALAYLGEKDAAIVEARRATELLPESVDAFSGPELTQVLAEVYMVTGENAKAIEVIDELLGRPAELTVAFLKIDPVVDRLRTDPAFQSVLAKHESKS